MVNIDYLYKPDAAKAHFTDNYFVDKELGFSVVENGTILPRKYISPGKNIGGIINNAGKSIQGSFVHRGVTIDYTPPSALVKYRPETVVYLGAVHDVWGHQISDSVKYLYFLKSLVFEREFKKCPLVYVSVVNIENVLLDSSYQNFRRLLEILEIDPDRLQQINQPTKFDKIILPDESFYYDTEKNVRQFTKEYRETIDSLKNFAIKNWMPTSSKKIYYFYGRREQIGEERLAEYFKSKGYEIVSPEKFTLDEQLNLLINCENFASTIGSTSHNSIFLRDGVQTIFIPRIAKQFNSYQSALNCVNSINAIYVDSTLSLFGSAYAGYCFIVSKQLKKFFGDKFNGYEERDFETFLRYISYSSGKGFTCSQVAKEYYNEVFEDFLEQLKCKRNMTAKYYMPANLADWRPLLTYQTHVSSKGWGSWNNEDQISNPLEQKLQIEAVKINFLIYKLYYSVYYNDNEGWSEEVTSPEMAGTTGKVKAIYGIRIRLDEAGAKKFDILYRVHKFDDTWTAWAKNGEVIYSHGVKLNAIQIKLEPKT
ncbi:MAG: DUF563 domain-containing protein [Selenomonadaceae bacterium]|nr:DUF563 domain-containing protein [Selenomonadaceae bacterium]